MLKVEVPSGGQQIDESCFRVWIGTPRNTFGNSVDTFDRLLRKTAAMGELPFHKRS